MAAQGMAGEIGGAVRCERCGGLVAVEPAAEIDPEASFWRRDSWRCLLCGNYRDPVIAVNRALADSLRCPHP